jgi:hypothetical protein
LKIILILYSHVCLDLPSGLFPSGFPTKTLYTPLLYPIRATCPAQLILLDFVTRSLFTPTAGKVADTWIFEHVTSTWWRELRRPEICAAELTGAVRAKPSSRYDLCFHHEDTACE